MNKDGNILQIETYLHQKSLYGRFGKPEWKWKLYGGFNHQVFWGNEKDIGEISLHYRHLRLIYM